MKKNQCQITGKRSRTGFTVSHSHRKTKRRFNANLTTKKLFNPATNSFVKLSVSARGLKTIAKWQREGRFYDLRTYQKSEA